MPISFCLVPGPVPAAARPRPAVEVSVERENARFLESTVAALVGSVRVSRVQVIRSKHGTSAGLAMVAVLVSLFTGRPVRRGLAMKLLAARRCGLTTGVLPCGKEQPLDVCLGGDDVGRGVAVHSVSWINHFVELVLRPAEAACSLAVELAAPYRAAPTAGVPE